MVRPRTFFDFSVDSAPAGRVVFELFNDTVPKTVENFRALCTGELGSSKVNEDVALHYKGSIVHRSIANFMIQGGDFTRHNGKGGESIYGVPFDDEDLSMEVDKEGLLVMANKGPNTNGSQWFITLRPCPHLNGKHVVFGRVVAGYNIVEKVAEVPVDDKSRPLQEIKIVHCGELELRKAPVKPAAPPPRPRSTSISSSAEREARDAKKRRNRSPSRDDSDSEDRKARKSKHHKKDRHKKSRRSLSPADEKLKEEREETEAELDARLEREEKERLAAEKKRRLEELRKQAPEEEASGGIRYKGRGRMKFKDPEARLRGW